VSIGVASGIPALAADRPETLTQAADTELYRAKTQGRNRTMPVLPEAEHDAQAMLGSLAAL